MRGRLMIVGGAVLAVALLGAALVVPSFADEPTPTPEATPGCRGWGLGFGRSSWATFDAVAEALGLTPEGLFAELHSGKTIADLAEKKGVELQDVCDVMSAARAEAMKAAINQAVEDGRLTQEQADWLLKGQELAFPLKGGRFGRRGWGRGRFGFGLPCPGGAAPSSS